MTEKTFSEKAAAVIATESALLMNDLTGLAVKELKLISRKTDETFLNCCPENKTEQVTSTFADEKNRVLCVINKGTAVNTVRIYDFSAGNGGFIDLVKTNAITNDVQQRNTDANDRNLVRLNYGYNWGN